MFDCPLVRTGRVTEEADTPLETQTGAYDNVRVDDDVCETDWSLEGNAKRVRSEDKSSTGELVRGLLEWIGVWWAR